MHPLVPVSIVAAPTPNLAAQHAFAALAPLWAAHPGEIALLAATGAVSTTSVTHQLRRAIAESGNAVTLHRPPSTVGVLRGLTTPATGPTWATIDLASRGAEHLTSAVLPRALVEAAALIAIAEIGHHTTRDPLAIGVLARFGHPRLAAAARLGGDQRALAAEIALARPPDCIVLVGKRAEWSLVVTTPDLVAAELLGLALRQEDADLATELIGPWEHPLVQRATELELGIVLPTQLRLIPQWHGTDPAPARFLQLIDRLALRLGVSPARS